MITNAIVGESLRIAPVSAGGMWTRLGAWCFRRLWGTPVVRIEILGADDGFLEIQVEMVGMQVSVVQEYDYVPVPATEENLEREFGDLS